MHLANRLVSILIAMLSITLVTRAQHPLGKVHPASVPDTYVVTPFGYFHPSCVKHLEKDDLLHLDQHLIQHGNGTFDVAPQCSFPRYSRSGQVIGNTTSLPGMQPMAPSTAANTVAISTSTTINGWVESAEANTVTNSSYSRFQAKWTVPPNPTSTDSFVLGYFIGLQSSTSPQGIVTILQPVLNWTTAGWAISAWNCCAAGTTFVSSYASVKTGDEILGSITSNCAPGTLSCSNWNVTVVDQTTKASESLVHTSSFGQTFDTAYGAVVEVYGVTNCADYPPNGTISFNSLSLVDYNNKAVTPTWTYAPAPLTLSPQCDYTDPVLTADQVVLQYGSLIVPTPRMSVQKQCTTNSAGTATCNNYLTITDAFESAAIYYTSNGTTPTPASTLYTGPILVPSMTTFKAIAVLAGVKSPLAILQATPAQ